MKSIDIWIFRDGEYLPDTSDFAVYAGAWDINDDSGNSGAVVYEIASITLNPNYEFSTKDYDVALLTLTENIAFIPNVIEPCCLASNTMPFNVGDNITISAWGKSSDSLGEFYTPIQQKANVTLECDSYCDYQADPPYVPERMFCTNQNSKGFCDGDIGGPAFEIINGEMAIFGIMSHQVGCKESPAYYTRIAGDIKTWIENGVQECLVCS